MPVPPFTPWPPVKEDQVACLCQHSTDVHVLEDIRLTSKMDDPDMEQLFWRFRCEGYFIPVGGFGKAVGCDCKNIRPPQPLPPVEPEMPNPFT